VARVQGTVLAEPGTVVFADATLTVGKKKHVERREGPGRFTLRLGSGRTIEVRGVVTAERSGKVELRGTYGELVSHPIARLFDAHAPGDHVRAEIRGFGLFAGDVVTVTGEVLEERVVDDGDAGEGGGLRHAPRREPAVIGAERIVLGRESDEAAIARSEPQRPEVEERPRPAPDLVRRPLETSARNLLALGLVLLVPGLVLSWVAPIVPERAWLTPMVGLGLAFALIGLHRLTRGRWHASYVTVVGGKRVTPAEPILGHGVDVWLVIVGYASWAWLCAIEPSPSAVTVCLAACAVLPAIHVGLVAYQEAAFRRFASLVLALPQKGPALDARMVLVEGRVSSSGTVVRRRVEFVPKSETTYSTDKNGHTHESTSTVLRDREHTSAETIVLESTGTPTIEVQVRGALVALAHRAWVPHPSLAVYEETLSHGETVCVAARLEPTQGKLCAAARGDESLFVFGGSRAELVRALWLARLRLVLGGVLVLTPIVLGLYAFPFAARFHATGTVTSSSGAVPVGESCSVRVLAYHYGEEPRCSLRLACGGVDLYGGFGMGQMDCSFEPDALEPTVSGSDSTAFDGDPAVSVSLRDRTLSFSDESGASVLVRLEPARPSLWW
jgi:hypothetical protein